MNWRKNLSPVKNKASILRRSKTLPLRAEMKAALVFPACRQTGALRNLVLARAGSIHKKIFNGIKGEIRLQEPLKNHTTFRIGGPAEFFIEPKDLNDLRSLLSLVKRYRLPVFVIGKGSNLLVSDKGVSGVVICLNSPHFNKISYKGNYISVGSGVSVSRFIMFAKEHGLTGAEFLAGIPGTIGGALTMNAGSGNRQSVVRSIQELVKEVTVMDYAGDIKALQKKDIRFSYRKSSLSKYIILGAKIGLAKESKDRIGDRIKEYMSYRKSTQDLCKPSAGCIFKNPSNNSAGKLIDLCGLKGKRTGNAEVSLKHANFIINAGCATADDVCKLMGLIRKEVYSKFHISLTPEIKIWQN